MKRRLEEDQQKACEAKQRAWHIEEEDRQRAREITSEAEQRSRGIEVIK